MRWFRILTLLLVLPCYCLSQSESATLSGRVTDSSGAAIYGAQVVLTEIQTNEERRTKTNSTGLYVFTGVKPGTYRVAAGVTGFKVMIKDGLTLHVQEELAQNFSLVIGAVSETVTVAADQNSINTTDASVSTVIDQSYVKNMPLNGRSFQDLILLTPGVVTNSPQVGSQQGMSGEFSVNGQRTEENYYTVDGVSANVGIGPVGNSAAGAGPSGSLGASTALGTTQSLSSVDSLQEFRVQSSSYSAEYGRNPGGQFAFKTKSGTNQWHGSAFEYLRNGAVDAADWFNGYFHIPYPQIHQNDFGGTFGGPIRIPHLYNGKDKTFFFVSYEGLRLTTPQSANITDVPDAALRASVPAVLQPVLNAFPVPNGPDLGYGFAEYIGSWSNPSSINSTNIRVDHALNDKTNLFLRFSDTGSYIESRPAGYGNPSNFNIQYGTMRTYTVGVDSALTSHIAEELRLNYSTNAAPGNSPLDGFGGATPPNIPQSAGLNPNAFAVVWEFDNGPYGTYIQENKGFTATQTQWNLVDSVSFASGRHAFKVGIDYRRLTPLVSFGGQYGLWVYYSSQSLQANNADFAESGLGGSFYPLYTNFSAFAQDEWRVTQRLNLSLGLRWDVNPPPGVTHGPLFWTMINATDPNTATLAPYGTPLYHTAWFNFGPRLGAAYTLRSTPGRETVVRAGGGLFFDTGQQLGSLGANYGPGQAQYDGPTTAPFPTLPPIPTAVTEPTPPYTGQNLGEMLYGYASHLQLPYTLQWNTSIQQALGGMQSLTVSYVGSHAGRLLNEKAYYGPDNPVANFWTYVSSGYTSDYNSLQGQFQRRLSAGLTALASYTWSHCLDYGSQNLSLNAQRGNCDMDVRHNFSAALSYDIPPVTQNKFAKAVLNHWGLDNRFTARTAFPVNLAGNPQAYPDGKIYFSGVNFVPGQPIYLYGANCASVLQSLGDLTAGQSCPGGRAINPNAFVSVDCPNTVCSTLGDVPRNFVRGFGAMQWDQALRREFPINERLKLQFRAEAFNDFNHPNFGSINGGFGQSTFGQATATLANSLGVLSPLYQMGGPRSMQFALRFEF